MKKPILLPILLAAAYTGAASSAWAQTPPPPPMPYAVVSGGSAGNGRVTMSFETRLEPSQAPGSTAPEGMSGGVMVRDGSPFIYRYLLDKNQRKYLGYEASLEPGGGGTIRVAIRALTLSAAQLELKEPDTWSVQALPQYPSPQSVKDGGKLQFDLMTNLATGQRIVEYLELRLSAAAGNGALFVSAPAREFRVEDAELDLYGIQVTVNGKRVEEASGPGGLRSNGLWIYLPRRGRYSFSLAPRLDLGFERLGEVRGTEMNFRVAGDEVRIRSSRAIAPGGGPYHLYVLHEPGYRPAGKGGGEDVFVLGAGAVATPEPRVRE